MPCTKSPMTQFSSRPGVYKAWSAWKIAFSFKSQRQPAENFVMDEKVSLGYNGFGWLRPLCFHLDKSDNSLPSTAEKRPVNLRLFYAVIFTK